MEPELQSLDVLTKEERGSLEDSLFWKELSQQWALLSVAKDAAETGLLLDWIARRSVHSEDKKWAPDREGFVSHYAPFGRKEVWSWQRNDSPKIKGVGQLERITEEIGPSLFKRLWLSVQRLLPFVERKMLSVGPDPRSPDEEEVWFVVAHAMRPTRSQRIQVWIYNSEHHEAVRREIHEAFGGCPALRSPIPFRVRKRRKLRISLEAPGTDEKHESEARFWEGRPLRVEWSPNVAAPEMNAKFIARVRQFVGEPLRDEFRIADVAEERRAPPPLENRIFFSYASDDRPKVEEERRKFEKLPYVITMDHASLSSGSDWATKILELVRHCDWLYLFWSAAASRSEWIRREVETFLAVHPDRIRPYLLDQTRPPEWLRTYHFSPISHCDAPHSEFHFRRASQGR